MVAPRPGQCRHLENTGAGHCYLKVIQVKNKGVIVQLVMMSQSADDLVNPFMQRAFPVKCSQHLFSELNWCIKYEFINNNRRRKVGWVLISVSPLTRHLKPLLFKKEY